MDVGEYGGLLYEDDFEYADYALDENGLDYVKRRGGTPRYTTDQGGAFEVGFNGLVQQIDDTNRPGGWGSTPIPYTVLSDDR